MFLIVYCYLGHTQEGLTRLVHGSLSLFMGEHIDKTLAIDSYPYLLLLTLYHSTSSYNSMQEGNATSTHTFNPFLSYQSN